MCGNSIPMTDTRDHDNGFARRLDALSDEWKSKLFSVCVKWGFSLIDCDPRTLARAVIFDSTGAETGHHHINRVIYELFYGKSCEICNNDGWIPDYSRIQE